MSRPIAAVLAAAALLCAPAFANAENFVAKVKTSDLNLQTEAGIKTALTRVRRAAVNACTDVEVGSRIGHADQACVSKISIELVKRINVPTVEAAYAATLKPAVQG